MTTTPSKGAGMKNIKKIIIMNSIFLFSVLAAPPPLPGEATKIRVVYTEWFPYTFQEKAKASGFEIETFKAVMKKMNLEAEFTAYPWKRCLSSLEKGEADVLISLLKTPERERYTYFPHEYISISRTVFFTTVDRNIKFTGSYEELKGYSVGVIMGFSYGETFDKASYLKKDEAENASMLIGKLLKGRNDLAAENQAVINASALKMGVKNKIIFLEPPIHTQKLYVGFSKAKGLNILCDAFSKSLGEFKKSESYKAILEKYGVKYSEMMAEAH
ncbi:MAG: transporter substrate-binding domain-containing protein [Thermodesulfobacteriota bacterium]